MNATCANPLGLDTLAAYWARDLDAPAEASVEEHILGCGGCTANLEWLVETVAGIKTLVRRGELRTVLSEALLDELKREGLRTREYAPPAGGRVECTIAPDDDLLIGRMAADLSGAERIDLVMCNAEGTEMGRMADIPFQAGHSQVIVNEPAAAARLMDKEVLRVRLVEPQAAGDRLVAEYTFSHSRWNPDP